MNYTKIIKGIRRNVRDLLRMELIIKRKEKISNIKWATNKLVDDINNDIKAHEHEIARNEYAISKLEINNPDYQDIKDSLTKQNELMNKHIDEMLVDITDLTLESELKIKNQKEKIMDIESGKVKVNLDRLNDISMSYLNKFIESNLVNITK